MADGYEDPTEELPPRQIAISGNGRLHQEWRTRRNGIIDALLIAGIIALVTATIGIMRTTDKVETAFAERSIRYDGEIARIDRGVSRNEERITRNDERITRLERQQGEPESYAHRRQER